MINVSICGNSWKYVQLYRSHLLHLHPISFRRTDLITRNFTPTMDYGDSSDVVEWPPGTVRIETLQRRKGDDIVLQPRPTDNPNDPLNW